MLTFAPKPIIFQINYSIFMETRFKKGTKIFDISIVACFVTEKAEPEE